MAIVFPRDVPDYVQVTGRSFTLERDMSVNMRRGKPAQVIDKSDPRWSIQLQFRPLERASWRRVHAWWESLQGGLFDFLAHDFGHPRPIVYRTGFDGLTRHGGGAFDGTAGVSALTASTITIDDLPSDFALTAGDYVGLVEDGAYALHMVMEDATASAGVVAVTVQPFVKTGIFSTSATVNLEKPKARFLPVNAEIGSEIGRTPFSLQGIQGVY